MQDLQLQLDDKTEDYDQLMELFNAFRELSDYEATNLLARFRLGENIEELRASLKAQEGLTASSTASEYSPLSPEFAQPVWSMYTTTSPSMTSSQTLPDVIHSQEQDMIDPLLKQEQDQYMSSPNGNWQPSHWQEGDYTSWHDRCMAGGHA